MRFVAATLLAALAASPSAAAPGLLVGVVDDTTKWTNGANRIGGVYRQLGLDVVRVTVSWRPGQTAPDSLQRKELERTVRATTGIRLVFTVYGKAADAPRDAAARETYCGYVRALLARFPRVTDVVIWNEANSPSFWKGTAPDYGALLGRCHALLHAFRADVNVISTTAASHDPGGFIRKLGPGARVDTVGHNPYPVNSSEAPWVLHAKSKRIAQADIGRLRQAVLVGFGSRKPIWYLEQGFQTPSAGRVYHGRETESKPTADQAGQLADAVRLASCQADVGAFLNFQLIDERDLGGWQSGLLTADYRPKPSFEAYRSAIAEVERGDVDCSRFPAAARK
ncbi:MAG: hypothetical protein WD689_00185 [Gaiellaceae bacterium]